MMVQFKASTARTPKPIHREGFVTILVGGDVWLCEEQTYAEAVAAGEMAPHEVVPRPIEAVQS